MSKILSPDVLLFSLPTVIIPDKLQNVLKQGRYRPVAP